VKFTCLTEIYAPRKKVIELWKNPKNYKHWQDGFEAFKLIEGKQGEVGSRAFLTYNNKGNQFDLEETVVENKLPETFEGEYLHVTMTNRMKSTFVALDTETTIWKVEIHYTQFNGIAMKLFGFFGKRIFKKQTQKWLDNFKAFAESDQH
jgi:uncharacterized membrane protein